MLIQRPKRPLFPPPNPAIRDLPPARNKGDRSLNVLTATGTVTLRRRYFWSRSTGGLCPVDVRVGIHHRTVTTGACCILCTLGVIHDFKQAAEDLYTVAGIRVSSERLRQIVESQGRRVMEVRLSGALDPGWSAAQVDRVYVGVDGVMVRDVTQTEKQKRRRQHKVRRKEREQVGIGNAKPLPSPSSGTTDTFKEMKIGVFYDQSKADRFTFATQEDHAGFGRLMEKHADQLALSEAPTLTQSPCLSLVPSCPSRVRNTAPESLSSHNSTLDPPGITRGRLVRVWGQMGEITNTSSVGSMIGPPAASEYAVDPVGVLIMRPSAW